MTDDGRLGEAIVGAAIEYGGRMMLPLAAGRQLAGHYGLSPREVEIAALRRGVAPLRYARNLGTVGPAGQIALLEACVAVVGLGGLGGGVVEGLARSGVGRIIAVDCDNFEEHNLNRQLLSSEAALGTPKANAASERVAAINAAVEVTAHCLRLGQDNAGEVLGPADVIVDALDNLPDRLVLQEVAAGLGKPLVHGAIAGFLGQMMVIFPGDRGLRALYPEGDVPRQGLEATTGTPAATPMLVAALQVQETVKLITGVGTPMRRCLLLLDTETGDFQRLELPA